MTNEKGCLVHDDKVDALEMLVKHLLEYIGVDESRGIDNYREEQFDKMLESIIDSSANLHGHTSSGRGMNMQNWC